MNKFSSNSRLPLAALVTALVLLGSFYFYGLSLPEEHESVTQGIVPHNPAVIEPWAFLTRPDTWPTLFPFVTKTERLSRPLGEAPQYRVFEKHGISYTVRLHEDLAHRLVRWELVDSKQAEGTFAEAEVTPVEAGHDVKITEHVKMRSAFLRAYYQIFKGFETNKLALEKLISSSQSRANP